MLGDSDIDIGDGDVYGFAEDVFVFQHTVGGDNSVEF